MRHGMGFGGTGDFWIFGDVKMPEGPGNIEAGYFLGTPSLSRRPVMCLIYTRVFGMVALFVLTNI